MKNKILVTIGSKFTKEAKNILSELGDVDCLDLNQDEFEKIINQYDIVLVGLGINIDKQIINKAKKLKIIASATTGLDHIDIDYLKEKNIKLLSLRKEREFLNSISGTAELAFGLMIDLLRLTPFAFDSVKNYEWDREKFRGHNLYGQTLGIVGLGRLGSWMTKYANVFNMNVIAFDPYVNDDEFEKNNVKKLEFNKLLKESDIISLHIHLNKETENMFNMSVFEKMKDSAYLINTSRGEIVNEKDILVALRDKKIAGYATDVLSNELNFGKHFSNYPLVEYAKYNNNLIIAPHIGGMTHESREATDVFMANKIKEIVLVKK